MVKFSFAYSRDAQYDAQQRTVNISAKPAVGKELFSTDVVFRGPSSFESHFETERFIHGKIREYTLRSIAHSNLGSLKSATVAHLTQSDSQQISEASRNRLMAQNFPAYVLSVLNGSSNAQLLRDNAGFLKHSSAGVATKTVSSYDSSNSLVVASDASLMGSHGQGVDYVGFVAHALSSSNNAFNSQSSMDTFAQRVDTLKRFIAFAVASGLMSTSSSTTNVESDMRAETCIQRQRSDQRLKASSTMPCETRRRRAFSTAPLRYQQSMPTGPPQLITRWRNMDINLPYTQEREKHQRV